MEYFSDFAGHIPANTRIKANIPTTIFSPEELFTLEVTSNITHNPSCHLLNP
jgi:hypothetical protein